MSFANGMIRCKVPKDWSPGERVQVELIIAKTLMHEQSEGIHRIWPVFRTRFEPTCTTVSQFDNQTSHHCSAPVREIATFLS